MRYYFPHLDSLRAIIALSIVVLHCGGQRIFGEYSTFLRYGVDVFFGISGFLITLILLNKPTLKSFYIRRFLRLAPLYYAVLFLSFFLNRIVDIGFSDSWGWYFLYASNYHFLLDGYTTYNFLTPTWSLAIEEQFYLFFPLILTLSRNPKYVIISFIVIGLISYPLTNFLGLQFRFKMVPLYNFHTLGIGALLALVYHKVLRLPKVNPWLLIPIAAICILMYLLDFLFLRELLLIILIASMICVCVNKSIGFLDNRILQFTGKISYGIYLMHVPLYKLYFTLRPQKTLLDIIIFLVLLFGICILSYTYYESLFLTLKNKFAYTKQKTS